MLIVLFSTACLLILRSRAQEVVMMEKSLIDKLWDRTDKIPLLLEMAAREQIDYAHKDKIIDLRSRAMGNLALRERIAAEKEMTDLIADIFRKGNSGDAVFISLQKEFEESIQSIRQAVNDYNYALEKFVSYCRLPWFKVFQFLFKIRANYPLATP